MTLPVIVVGAGGHGGVVADALQAAGHRVLGFVDPRAELAGMQRGGLPVLGSDEALAAYSPHDVRLANGIGGTRPSPSRADVQARLESAGWIFIGVRHPSAIVSTTATIADTAQLLARCVVQTGARIGPAALVNTGAIVEHDVCVSAHVHVAPGAIVCGDVSLGAGCHVGAGAVVRQGLVLGPRTLVAAGAVVVRSHHDGHVLLAGVPAIVQPTP